MKNRRTLSIPQEVAFLGPEGTFAHLVAKKRYRGRPLVPKPTIDEVFAYVEESPARVGIVPIENSSGGIIYQTIDILRDRNCALLIQEELQVDVKLALVGRKDQPINVVYSHFAPLHHCGPWLKHYLPGVKRETVSSTALAARYAAEQPGAAALTTRDAAKLYGLDVLNFPVVSDVENRTQFVTIGHGHCTKGDNTKTSYAVELLDRVGALCDFLEPFKNAGVNLTRIISRPIVGRPNTYMFFVEIDGTELKPSVKAAVEQARRVCSAIRCLGAYAIRPPYQS